MAMIFHSQGYDKRVSRAMKFHTQWYDEEEHKRALCPENVSSLSLASYLFKHARYTNQPDLLLSLTSVLSFY